MAQDRSLRSDGRGKAFSFSGSEEQTMNFSVFIILIIIQHFAVAILFYSLSHAVHLMMLDYSKYKVYSNYEVRH